MRAINDNQALEENKSPKCKITSSITTRLNQPIKQRKPILITERWKASRSSLKLWETFRSSLIWEYSQSKTVIGHWKKPHMPWISSTGKTGLELWTSSLPWLTWKREGIMLGDSIIMKRNSQGLTNPLMKITGRESGTKIIKRRKTTISSINQHQCFLNSQLMKQPMAWTLPSLQTDDLSKPPILTHTHLRITFR